MRNPEILAQFQKQDLNIDQGQTPVEGKSFENLRRFVAHGAIAPIRIYPPGEKPDYSDRRIYYPSAKSTNLQNWERSLRMTYDYVFGEETLDEIAKRNGNFTRENARQIIKKTVRSLYDAADEEVRDRFAFESFDFKKSRSLASRQRTSEARGGISFGIARRLEQGATLDELKNDYTKAQIKGARHVVDLWGYKLEREKTPILPHFEGLRNLDTTDQQIQTLLDKIRTPLQYRVLKQAGLVINLTAVAKQAGLYIWSDQLHFISESLRKEKLPQTRVPVKIKDKNGQDRIVNYHFIAAVDEPNAVNILRADRSFDNLRINPVRQIAGPRGEKLPNTTILVKSGEYGSVGNLIGEITGSRWVGRIKGEIKTADIIKDSPVGIYRWGGGIYYRKGQEGKLRDHLESRLRTLGI